MLHDSGDRICRHFRVWAELQMFEHWKECDQREMDGQTDRDRHTDGGRETNVQTERDRWRQKQTDRETDGQAVEERQMDRLLNGE